MRTLVLVASSAAVLAVAAYASAQAPGTVSAETATLSPDAGSPDAAASASDAADPERALLARAAHAYDEGRFDDALRELEDGFRLYGKPAYLFNLGQVHRQRKNCDGALTAYDRFLALAPLADEHRAVALLHQSEMKRCATPVVVPAVATAPLPPIVQRPALPPEPAPPSGRRWMKPAGLTALGLALVSGGAAAYFAADAKSISDEVSQGGSRFNADRDAEGRSAQTKAIGFSASALVLAGAGAALLYFAPAVTLTPAPTAASVSAVINWSGKF